MSAVWQITKRGDYQKHQVLERICNRSNRKTNKKVLPGTEKVGRPNQASVTGKFCRNVPLLQLSCPTTTMDDLQRLLLTSVPLLAQPLPLLPLLQTATQASVMSYLSQPSDSARIAALLQASSTSNIPRPEQGGQRITEEWLTSLSNRDCQWRFR